MIAIFNGIMYMSFNTSISHAKYDVNHARSSKLIKSKEKLEIQDDNTHKY